MISNDFENFNLKIQHSRHFSVHALLDFVFCSLIQVRKNEKSVSFTHP